MQGPVDQARRVWLRRGLLALAAGPLTACALRVAAAAGSRLVKPDDPDAKALKYTEDAHTAKDVPAGNNCANCALFQGAAGAASGPCQAFNGRLVKATGWCSSWAPQM